MLKLIKPKLKHNMNATIVVKKKKRSNLQNYNNLGKKKREKDENKGEMEEVAGECATKQQAPPS